MTHNLTVLYDADCGVCTHTARALSHLDSRRQLQLVSIQEAALASMPSRNELLASLSAVDAAGRWYVGVAALVQICRRIAVLWPIIGAASLPFGMPVLGFYYRTVQNNRQLISRVLGLKVCAVHPQTRAAGSG